MAAEHIAFGERGEQLAADFLEEVGCRVLVRNYRWSRAEIDIVAADEDGLHFIEVKTRHWQDVEAASDSVGYHKQRNVMNAAGRYMDDHSYSGDFQFDIVLVLIDLGERITITWRKDAFGFFN